MKFIQMLVVVLLSSACAPKVAIQVLEPSHVTAPNHIQTVAFVDRSRVDGAGEMVLGAIEGLLTGEAIGADNSGRDEAEKGFREVFGETPRFDLVLPGDVNVDGGFFDKNMNWKVARRLCKSAGCQGIVALESFDSDSVVKTKMKKREKQNEAGKKVYEKYWVAERRTNVNTSWRFYDIKNKVVIDDLKGWSNANTFRYEGRTEDAAVSQLPSQRRTIDNQGYAAGVDYARRVAPFYVTVYRTIYTRGDPNLKASKDYVKTENWKEANAYWAKAAMSDKAKIRGRALYNMAVSKEVDGDLDGALALAEESNTQYPKGVTGDYAQMIRQRIWKKQKVEESLEAANRSEEDPADEVDSVEEESDSEEVDEDVKVRPSEDQDDQEVKVRPAE